jgi:hypothetical protein
MIYRPSSINRAWYYHFEHDRDITNRFNEPRMIKTHAHIVHYTSTIHYYGNSKVSWKKNNQTTRNIVRAKSNPENDGSKRYSLIIEQ